tara:strand:+ start:2779 stop:4008 length:1230 start_codon:yes stop_codon:yes gene_type:complete
MSSQYFCGLDFGSSGARISIINQGKVLLYSSSVKYKYNFTNPNSWILSCSELLDSVPQTLKENLLKISISGTSGTLLACSVNGDCLGEAIPYDEACIGNTEEISKIAGDNTLLNDPYSSLAKAFKLFESYGENIHLRHQVDWITGWLLKDWTFGEEGNNIKLGWNLVSESWPKNYNVKKLTKSLPKIIKSGKVLGFIDSGLAKNLNLNRNICIISGTTDSNAAFLAAQVKNEEGLTVLGTTTVLKKIITKPIQGKGITIHRVNDQWVCGGSSNAGGGILSRFFSDNEIEELSRQINPSNFTKLDFLPLNSKGERFPVNDPYLEPRIEPRPVSDALYLQGLFEGLARIELKGWQKIKDLTGTFPTKIVTIGGGSKNPQWRSIREKILKTQIISCDKTTSYGSALLALESK